MNYLSRKQKTKTDRFIPLYSVYDMPTRTQRRTQKLEAKKSEILPDTHISYDKPKPNTHFRSHEYNTIRYIYIFIICFRISVCIRRLLPVKYCINIERQLFPQKKGRNR